MTNDDAGPMRTTTPALPVGVAVRAAAKLIDTMEIAAEHRPASS